MKTQAARVQDFGSKANSVAWVAGYVICCASLGFVMGIQVAENNYLSGK